MTNEKRKLDLSKLKVISIKANPKMVLPLFYCGKVVFTDSKEPRQFEVDKLPYESKLHLIRAYENGHIELVEQEKTTVLAAPAKKA